MARVRLEDIAKNLNISINTVSRALRNFPDVNDETRSLVLKEAKRCGYKFHSEQKPTQKPASLGKSVGIIVPDCANPFFSLIIQGAQQVLETRNIDTILCDTQEQYSKEVKYVNLLLKNRVSGILLCSNQAESEDIKHLMSQDIPFVLIGRNFPNLDTDYVVSDDYQGAFLAVEHLIRLGHEKILFINTHHYISSAEQRLKGYLDAFAKNNLTVDQHYILTCSPTLMSAYNAMRSFFLEELPFTAVFAFSDLMMFGIFQAIQERSLSVPKDVSLVGFDNIYFSHLLACPLTTVNQQKREMGVAAANIILERIDGLSEPRKIILPTDLIIRESTTKLDRASLS